MSARRTRALILSMTLLCLAATGAAADPPAVPAPDPGRQKVQREIEDLSRMPGASRRLYFRVRRKVDAGDAEAAMALLDKRLTPDGEASRDVDHPLLRYEYGRLLAEDRRADEALGQYLKAVEMEPRFARAWLGAGDAAYRIGEYARASDAFLKGYGLGPAADPRYLYYAAVWMAAAGDHARAMPLFEELVFGTGAQPREDWCRALVASALETGATATAEAALEALIEEDPDSADAWDLCYTFHAATGDLRRAAADLQVVGYLRPLDADELSALGDLHFSLDAPARAARAYRSALDAPGDAPGRRDALIEKLGSALVAAHRHDLALSALLSYVRASAPDSVPPRINLMIGYSAIETGDSALADRYLRMAADDTLCNKTANDLLKYLESGQRNTEK